MIRRHHPLEGAVLEVVRWGRNHVVVRHPDSAPLRLPRAWTDAGVVARTPNIEADTQLTLASLRVLVHLVAALGERV